MTDAHMDFLPPDRQLFRSFDTLGEALKAAAKAAWPWNTANHMQRRWGLDPRTAENVAKGHGSARTLLKAVQAEGEDAWALWDAVGELIIGESREQYDERQFALILKEAALAREKLQDRQARRTALEARAFRLPEVGGGHGA
jgi:hypothetical protein